MRKLLKIIISLSLVFCLLQSVPELTPALAAAGPAKPKLALVATDTFADIYVAKGTSLNEVKLPDRVGVTLSNKGSQEVALRWDVSSYNKDVTGSYIFTGVLQLPAGVANPGRKPHP